MKKYLLILLMGISMSNNAENINPQEFIEQSFNGLTLVTEKHNQLWGLGTEKTWNVDLDKGKLFFNFENGTIASADVQVIGTFANNDTFMWGWEHPSVTGKPSEHAKLLRLFGEKYGIDALLQQPVTISEDQAWKYTALAMRLGNNNGAYRAQTNGTWVYMTFGKISLSKID